MLLEIIHHDDIDLSKLMLFWKLIIKWTVKNIDFPLGYIYKKRVANKPNQNKTYRNPQ